MVKVFMRPVTVLLAAFAIALSIAWQTSARSEVNGLNVSEGSVPPIIATAPSPPTLQPAILNGKPIQVLYITRSEDTVLVRCYPEYAPSLAVQPMGGEGGQQQGVLTCVSSGS
jgi:hypothetical protein